ncbi:MAG: C40 family peptidase [Cystobacterineae bacterium]|nr:C40 family peptidase [Cystobacterineae bacterium]
MKTLWLFLGFGMLTGCATSHSSSHSALLEAFAQEAMPPAEKQASMKPSAQKARKKVVETAQASLGKKQIVLQGKKYPNDCSGFVNALYAQVGIDLMQTAQPKDNAVTAMFRYAQVHGKIFKGGWPVPGDLVFFRNTYRLKTQRSSAALTHVGIVESMDADGTVYVIHRVQRGVVRYAMNLNEKKQTKNQHGKRINDYIRARQGSQPAKLTAELFVSYASLLPVESALIARNEK